MFSYSKILFLVPLLFVTSIPTYFLNFYFLIILVHLLFIHAKHSSTKLYQCTCTILLSNYNQSINQFILIFKQALKIFFSIFSHVPWHLIDHDVDIDLSWAMWKDLYLSAIDQTVPKLKWSCRKVKHWFSKDTISLIHRKR